MNGPKIDEAIHEITNFPETTKTKEEKESPKVKIERPVSRTSQHSKQEGTRFLMFRLD